MRKLMLSLAALLVLSTAHAADTVTVKDAWIRPPVPGSNITAAYMTLEARQPMTLVKASSPIAEAVEIHTMSMKNGVMEMREIKELPLKPGEPVALKEGGLHLMFINLKKPLREGDTVLVNLGFAEANQAKSAISVTVPVKAAP
jgi:copper(I)-binding protein